VNSFCHRDYGIPKGEMRGQALTGLTGSLFAEEIDIIEDQTGGEWRMTYERFEDLPVWKRAMDLAEKVYTLTEGEQFKKKYSLRDQIERIRAERS